MKKIISVLIVMLLSFQTISYAIPAQLWENDGRIDNVFGDGETENIENDILQELLFKLGILNKENFDPFKKADSKEFIKAVWKIKYMQDAPDDMNIAIDTLKKDNIIKSDKLSKNVYMDDIIFSALSITGYSMHVSDKTDPYEYVNIANSKKLLRNCKYHKEAVTNAEMAQLLYNIISVPSMVIDTISDDRVTYKVAEPETIMERQFDVVMVEGILNANYVTNIYSSDFLEKDIAEINRKKYNTSTDLRNLVGYNVNAFIVDNSDNPTIIAAAEQDNNVIVFDSADICEVYDNSVLVDTDDKNQKIKIEKDASIVYNGVYYSNYYDEFSENLTNKQAEIKAIDNDDNGYYDVFIVEEYKHYIADNNISTSFLKLKYNMKFNDKTYIDFDDKNTIFEVYKNGIQVDFKEILKENIISVAKSDSNTEYEYVKINIGEKSVTGKFISRGHSGNRISYLIDRKEYFMSDEYEKNSGITGTKQSNDYIIPEIGKKYMFLLSFDGKIADITDADEGLKAVYMLKAVYSEDIETLANVKVFDMKGNITTYPLADKVSYYDKDNQNGIRIEKDEVVTRLNSRNVADFRSVIKIGMNPENKINKLYLPIDCTRLNPGSTDYPLTLDFDSGSDTGKYHGEMINLTYITPRTMSVMQVPGTDDAENEDGYQVLDMDARGNEVSYRGLQLYCVDDYYTAEFAVWMDNSTTVSDDLIAGVIESVESVYTVDEEEALAIKWYRGKDKVNGEGAYSEIVYSENSDELVLDEWEGKRTRIKQSELKAGDIVQIEFHANGRVKNIRLLHRPFESPLFGIWQDSSEDEVEEFDKVHNHCFIGLRGEYVGSKGAALKVKLSDDGEKEKVVRLYKPMILLVDMKGNNKNVSVIKTDDLLPGDKLFVRVRYLAANLVVAYR